MTTFFQKGGAGSGRVAPYTAFLFVNFFFVPVSAKEKVAMKAEKPRGYSRLASANTLPAFLFDTRGTGDFGNLLANRRCSAAAKSPSARLWRAGKMKS